MADMRSKIHEIYALEQLSGGQSAVHRRHPLVKLVSALLFIILVVSFDRTEFGRLIPFLFYPVVLMALSGTPWGIVLKRLALALPFAVVAGISNIIFDPQAAFSVGGIVISHGTLSFFAILFRTFLCVTAALLLVAVTPFAQLTDQLRRMHIPDAFVSLFEMIYRYLGALLDEAAAMYTAYMLRSTARRGLQLRHMGSFVGQLFIRSFDRAERVYAAMKCRGYGDTARRKPSRPLAISDYAYLAAACLPFILLRLVDVPAVLSRVF